MAAFLQAHPRLLAGYRVDLYLNATVDPVKPEAGMLAGWRRLALLD